MSRPRILPVTGATGATGADALPSSPGDPAGLRACAARLRRAQGEARSLPSLRGQLRVVLPEVWVGAAADAAVREAGELVRRCAQVLDHLGAAATALDRHAADLELVQASIRRLQHEWDRLREDHARQSVALRSRAAVDVDAGPLLLRLSEQHDADLRRLTRLHDRCEAQLAASTQRTTRLLATLDDVLLPRQVAPDAAALRSRLGVGLPMITGAFASAATAARARSDGARLRAAAAGTNPDDVVAVVGSLRGDPSDAVYAQALVNELGVGALEVIVLGLAAAGSGSEVDRSRAAVGMLGTLLLAATVPHPGSAAHSAGGAQAGMGTRDPRTERQVQSAAALLRDALVGSLGAVSMSSDGRWTATGFWLTGQLFVGARAAGWSAPLPPALVRRLAAGIASAELAETRDGDATRRMGTSLPPSGGARFASLFEDADTTGDALHTVLGYAGTGESPSEVAALLDEPVDGHGVTGARGGTLVLAEALVRRWVTFEAGATASHGDLDLATNADLRRLVAIVDSGEQGGDEGQSAGLRARVMTELARTNSYAQQSFSTVPIYERNTAPLETTAVGWVLDMPKAIDALILRPVSPGRQWSAAVGGRHEPPLTLDELTGLIGAFTVGTDRARSAKAPDAPYRRLVAGELKRAREGGAGTESVESTALRLGFFEQAASAALVTVARGHDAANQSMWRTLVEAKALALSWKQGPVAFGSAVATVVGGDTNRTAQDDLTISLVRSNVELGQTVANEARARDLTSLLASIAVTASGAASGTTARFAAGAQRGTALPSSHELVAGRRREQLDALAGVAQEKSQDRVQERIVNAPRDSPSLSSAAPRPSKGPKPLPHELATAERLRRAGHDVEFLARSDTAKMPDALVDGERWEFKAPIGTSATTVTQAVRHARRQSPRIIIELARSPLSMDEALRQVDDAIRRYDRIEVVLVITAEGDIIERRP